MTLHSSTGRVTAPTAAMHGVIARIEEILSAEAMCLEALQDSQIRQLNERKARALLEFSRTVRSLSADAIDDDLRVRISKLRDALEENKALVARHLSAARDIAALVAKAMEDMESDGTYSSRIAIGDSAP